MYKAPINPREIIDNIDKHYAYVKYSKGESIENVNDKEFKEYSNDVDEVMNGTYDLTKQRVKVSNHTPKVLIENTNLKDLPMLIEISHLKKAVGLGKQKGEQHNLSIETLKQLPLLMNDPLFIYDNGRNINIVLNEVDKSGRLIKVVIKRDESDVYNRVRIDFNNIKTVHD